MIFWNDTSVYKITVTILFQLKFINHITDIKLTIFLIPTQISGINLRIGPLGKLSQIEHKNTISINTQSSDCQTEQIGHPTQFDHVYCPETWGSECNGVGSGGDG